MICAPWEISSPFVFHGEKHTYCIGIIDFLQKYNCVKAAEVYAKSILSEKEEISVQNPKMYAERFQKKMIEYMSVIY